MARPRSFALLALLLGYLAVGLACRLETSLLESGATQSTAATPALAADAHLTPTPVRQLQIPDTPTAASPAPAADPTHEIDESWHLLRPGLEKRTIRLLSDAGQVEEALYLLRIDPALFIFDVGYKPGEPQQLMDWQRETGALIVVNGGYFTAEGLATGLIITDGQAAGASYVGFGGMLAVTNEGPELRSLKLHPYNPNEQLLAALQSFPLLVTPDGQIGYPHEDGLADRRTVIGQDRRGRILFILATTGTMTLNEMGRYLLESDLDLSTALNLDGGASTGLLLSEPVDGVAPFSLLPVVITVHPRQ